MKKLKTCSFLLLAGLLLAAACTKEATESTPEGARGKRLILVTDQQRDNGAKVMVNESSSMWAEGDLIYVNGSINYVEYVDGQFQLKNEVNEPQEEYFAAYASVGGMNRSDVRYGISLDEGKDYATITYKVPSQYFLVGWNDGVYPCMDEFPLMGMTHRDSTRLYMRPVGACINLQLTNSTSNPIVVDSVVLTCNLSINGERTLKFWPGVNGQNPQLVNADQIGTTASTAANKRVAVLDPKLSNGLELTIDRNKTRSFPIPLASTQRDPGSSDRPQITITVYGKAREYVCFNEFGGSMLLNEVPFSYTESGTLSRQIPVGAYFTAQTELTDENTAGKGTNHELYLLEDDWGSGGFSGEHFEGGEDIVF